MTVKVSTIMKWIGALIAALGLYLAAGAVSSMVQFVMAGHTNWLLYFKTPTALLIGGLSLISIAIGVLILSRKAALSE